MKKKYLDFINREDSYLQLLNEMRRTEVGLHAIAFMYDDHSNDKNSYDNILTLKDNIQYRLSSATHQYLVFLRELGLAEDWLQKKYNSDPRLKNVYFMENPYFKKVEQELSSIFDNLIFNISSIFDYLSHIISYMVFRNKSKTVYWTKLAKMSRGNDNELSNLKLRLVIDKIDRHFVGRLYDYRSRLLHNKRDKHKFECSVDQSDFSFTIMIVPSEISIKHFKQIKEGINEDVSITLTYFSSWIIERVFTVIEEILDAIKDEILRKSFFHQNIIKPKRKDGAMFAFRNVETNTIEPASKKMWENYKNNIII